MKKIFVIFHPFAQKPPHGPICTKFGTAAGVADVITSNNFFGDRCGVWILWGSKIAISH